MKNPELDKVFACPDCNGDLEFSEDAWRCPSCTMSWTIDRSGVVHFLNESRFFGVDQEGMNKLLGEMRSMSANEFFGSVEKLEANYRDFEYSYCLDPARADWTILGEFYNKTIVDLGCGFGTISIPLAGRAKQVISVDAAKERIEFLSLIANFKGIKNIVPIHADVFKLPLKNGSVDTFILSGLLEWAGTWKESKSPTNLQSEFLLYLRKYLRDEGELWIGIENRLSPMYFVGKTDHGDLPFTPLMPRKMADLFTYIVKGQKYKIYTYSERTYVKLLQNCGYSHVKVYYAFPDYMKPRFILSNSRKDIFSMHIKKLDLTRGKSLQYKIGYKVYESLGLYRTFAPSFIIQAKKD